MANTESVISTDDGLATLLNIFDVDAERQQELVDILAEGTEKVMQHRPGFVSVNILKSLDGTKVVNYAQWRNADDIKATMSDPEAQAYAKKAGEIAKPTPGVYAVSSIYHV